MIDNLITVVCGLPRSGTSLMMQILEAAGIRCAGEYPAFEPVEIMSPDLDFVNSMRGGAFKLLDPHLTALPKGPAYRFIFMTRSRRQQSISLVKLMRFSKTIPAGPISDEKMEEMRNALAYEEFAARTAISKHIAPVLRVRFEDLIERTTPTVWRIADFLANWHEAEMIACVRPRSATVFNGMLELDLVAEREERIAAEKEAETLPDYDPLQCQCGHPPYPAPCSYCEGGNYNPDSV